VDCKHEMTILTVGNEYVWADDILNLELREVWECEKCGEVTSVKVEQEDVDMMDEEYLVG